MRSLLIILLFFSCKLSAQTYQPNLISKNEVSIVGYWSVGDKKSFHLTRTRNRFKNDKKKPTETTTYEYDLQLSILDSTDTSYLMRMTYKNLEIQTNKKSNDNPFTSLDNYSIEYTTDELGAFDSITNLKQLSELVKKQFLASMNERDESDSTQTLMNDLANQVFDNMELLNLFFQEDIVLLHSIYGIQLKLETPIDFELEYPILNDVQMLGEGKVTLKTIDKERDFCSIFMTQRPYDEEIDAFLAELITGLFQVDSAEFQVDDYSFDAASKVNYSMELSSGWMKKVSNKSTVTAVVKNKKIRVATSTVLEEK